MVMLVGGCMEKRREERGGDAINAIITRALV